MPTPLPVVTAPKVVSPSRIARFYFQECERFLRYSSTPEAARAAEGVPTESKDESDVASAILEAGYTWEEEVVGTRLAGRVKIAPADPGTALRNRFFSPQAARQQLAALKPGEFVYQPTLAAPPGFYARYGLDSSVVRMANCRPDLVQLAETPAGPRLRVVDVKASPGLKLAHRVQAALYTMLLEALVAEWGLPVPVDTLAGIWLGETAEPELFDTRTVRPTLETFLAEQLQPLMAAPADAAGWHVFFRCEWCPYFEHCRDEMRRTDSVSRLPFLSTYAKRHLRALDPPAHTLADLRGLLADPARVPELERCASLKGKADRLRCQLDAFATDAHRAFGGGSLALPKGENVRLVLTLQVEPVTGQVYAYGIYAQGFKGLIADPPGVVLNVAKDGEPDTVAALEREFVRELHDLLTVVHVHNRRYENDFNSQKSLQTYVADGYERTLLTEVLLRRVADPAVAAEATELFFHFQQPDLIHADTQPADEVFFPLVVLVDVVARLLALPAETNVRLVDAAALLRPAQYAFNYPENPRFAFALSNQMRSDAVQALWHQNSAGAESEIRAEVRARVLAGNSVLNGLREALTRHGLPPFAWPPKFKLPSAFEYRDPLLSRLAFITRYESVIRYVETRSARSAPLGERLASGTALRLTYRGDDEFEIDPSQAELPVPVGAFPNWLLHADTDAGHRAAIGYDDFNNRTRVWVPKNAALALAGIADRAADGGTATLNLEVKTGSATPLLVAGARYLLTPRFTDFNSDRVIEELNEANAEPDPYFLSVVRAPHLANAPVTVPDAVRARARALAQQHQMTASQLSAFEGLLGSRLRVVWGPPGTGKTHFLALAVLCLAEAHRGAKLPLRVALSGFTHASIDNCLNKAHELQRALKVVAGEFPIGKLGTGTELVPGVAEKGADRWLTERPVCLLGGTVWAFRKGVPAGRADVVIIDEGSQFRVPEAVIAVRRLKAGGRLVVAGDDKQLPPIVQAEYPDPVPGEPLLHRSLFECLRAQDPNDRFTSTLLENWRMNDTLCRYPAAQVYVPAYRSATPEIAARRLRLGPADARDPLSDLLLDPEFPLVVVVVRGVQAAAENRVEAGIVGRAAARLRTRLLARNGKPYTDDAAFWEHGAFVVSPHHAQIAAVRRELDRHRTWTSEPFVDTVDKMQGQECDAVLVTYGVADPEYALSEKEFIYSLNRLNVAITRARCKTVLVVSEALLAPPLAAYESEDTAAGIAFMQGLTRYAGNGEETVLALTAGVSVRVLRLR
ncbi:MAG TPA: AAA domain-containing protein [Gemmata sp.]